MPARAARSRRCTTWRGCTTGRVKRSGIGTLGTAWLHEHGLPVRSETIGLSFRVLRVASRLPMQPEEPVVVRCAVPPPSGGQLCCAPPQGGHFDDAARPARGGKVLQEHHEVLEVHRLQLGRPTHEPAWSDAARVGDVRGAWSDAARGGDVRAAWLRCHGRSVESETPRLLSRVRRAASRLRSPWWPDMCHAAAMRPLWSL